MGTETSIAPQRPSLLCQKGRMTKILDMQQRVGSCHLSWQTSVLPQEKNETARKAGHNKEVEQTHGMSTCNGNTKDAGWRAEAEWKKMWWLELAFAALCPQSAIGTLTTHTQQAHRQGTARSETRPQNILSVMLPSCRCSALPFVHVHRGEELVTITQDKILLV